MAANFIASCPYVMPEGWWTDCLPGRRIQLSPDPFLLISCEPLTSDVQRRSSSWSPHPGCKLRHSAPSPAHWHLLQVSRDGLNTFSTCWYLPTRTFITSNSGAPPHRQRISHLQKQQSQPQLSAAGYKKPQTPLLTALLDAGCAHSPGGLWLPLLPLRQAEGHPFL